MEWILAWVSVWALVGIIGAGYLGYGPTVRVMFGVLGAALGPLLLLGFLLMARMRAPSHHGSD